jgi:phage shock protein E
MPFPTDYDTRAATFGFAKPGEVRKALEDPATMLLDVRNAEEVSAASLGGDRGVITPLTHEGDALNQAVKDHGKDETIVVYCRSGKRANLAIVALEGLGFKKIMNAGGLNDMIATLE